MKMAHFLASIILTGAWLLIAGMLHPGTFAQTLPPHLTQHHDQLESTARLPDPLTADRRPDASAPASTPGEMAAWSKIVFQSIRDNVWEVYIAAGDGSNQVRLTNSGAPNIRPRLNRGATRIVFMSGRTGNYEIYTMNVNGSGLTQLTFNSTDDYNPAWSPDGTKITFNSFHDGQSEIYVMNADGSAQTRLTFDAGYDGQPIWSPDGTKIAFTSDRLGGDRIWVMNANGSGQAQLSNQAYSENPAWSPDGSQIAYDCDGDSDGWQELWTMNSNGSNQRQAYEPPTNQTDLWARSWSPDGRYIAITRIAWVYEQGNWYWIYAVLSAWDTVSGIEVTLNSQGADWFPDWQTADIVAPTSAVQPLPQYSRAAGTMIKWSGSDVGPGGLKNFDLQYRLGPTGTWSNWLTTNQTSASYSGGAGQVVYFRSRARDNANNVEAWPAAANGDAWTTMYTQQFAGDVTDNRGLFLPHVSIPITPAAITSVHTDRAGRFTAYLAIAGAYAFAPSQAGYGTLPTSTLIADADRTINLHLPPVDDRIQNGGFEQALLHWQTSGVVTPTVSTRTTHTGQSAAFLGQPAPFAVPQKASASDLADMPAAAYDQTGLLHLAWREIITDINSGQIRYTICPPYGACLPSQALFSGISPHIGIGSDSIVHLIWTQGNSQIMYAQRSLNGTWSTPLQIAQSREWYEGNATLTVDHNNVPHVAWNDYRAIYYSHRNFDGTWTPAELVSGSMVGVVPAIVVASNGIVHVVWTPGAAGAPVGYNLRASGTGWSQPRALSVDLYYGYAPAIALDSQGGAHIVWQEWISSTGYLIIQHVYRSVAGDWSPVATVQTNSGFDLRLVVQPDDRLVMLWRSDASSAGQLVITYRRNDGTWSAPRLPFGPGWTNTAYSVLAARPDTDRLAVATAVLDVGGSPYRNVYFSQFDFEPEVGGHSQLQQSVTIPSDIHRPTLGVTYVYTTEDTPANDLLSISVVDEGSTTSVVTLITSTIGWEHTWLDLTPWQGKTITVTVDLSMTANDHFSWGYIDEVTVGSWHTPVPQVITPDQIDAWTSTTITVTGENFLDAPQLHVGDLAALDVHWIDTNTLAATLPALSPGRYEVLVTNPGGQANITPDDLIAGKLTYLPIIFK